jgi:hypothetical protein
MAAASFESKPVLGRVDDDVLLDDVVAVVAVDDVLAVGVVEVVPADTVDVWVGVVAEPELGGLVVVVLEPDPPPPPDPPDPPPPPPPDPHPLSGSQYCWSPEEGPEARAVVGIANASVATTTSQATAVRLKLTGASITGPVVSRVAPPGGNGDRRLPSAAFAGFLA